jgi:hypothetical protein
MAISDALKVRLNKMCISAKEVLLGDIIQDLQNQIHSSHTVDAAEETAGSVDIVSGLSSISGFIVQVYRADILLGSYDVSASVGTLTVATNETDYVVTENDVINYIVY